MIGIVIVSENKESTEILKSVRRLLGSPKNVIALSMGTTLDLKSMKKQLKEAITKVNDKEGVLLLTPVFGSTQSNICLQFVKKGAIELIAGFNTPMVIKLMTLRNELSFDRLIPFIEQYGKDHISHHD